MERKIPNYSEYYINQNIEYSLYDEFTHKRPVAFKLNNEKEGLVNIPAIIVKKW